VIRCVWIGLQLGRRPKERHTDAAVKHVVVSDLARIIHVVDAGEEVDEASLQCRPRSMATGVGAGPAIAANRGDIL
jgi:hypothetical protein